MKRLIVAAICLLFASPAFAQKVGDTVVVIAEKRAQLKSRSEVVGTVPRGNHLRVDQVNAEWFWVFGEGKKGWINRSDVIHIDRAIDFFTAAIRRNPIADDYEIRGSAWEAKGEYDKAISDHNEAIRLDPKFAAAYNSRGHAWKAKREIDKAISDHNEAIRLDPKFAAAYNSRGNAWKFKGEIDKAISDYNEAIRLDPKDAHLYNQIAWIQATHQIPRYRDGRKAVENATKACELTDWKNDSWIDTLAAAYAENGDFSEAVRWQQKAIELASSEKLKADYRSRLSLYQARKPYRAGVVF